MDRGMRNVYDTPNIEAILDEQRTEFPSGAMGELQAPVVDLTSNLQEELVLLTDWREGRLGTVELMGRLEAIKRRHPAADLRT